MLRKRSRLMKGQNAGKIISGAGKKGLLAKRARFEFGSQSNGKTNGQTPANGNGHEHPVKDSPPLVKADLQPPRSTEPLTIESRSSRIR